MIEDFVELRSARSEDSELIASWLNNEEICRFLSSNLRGRVISPQLVNVTLKRRDQAWTIVLVDSEPVGILVLDDFDATDGIANLWYCLGNLLIRGRRIMPAAIGLLASSPPLPVGVISAWVGSNNIASLRCLERGGFRLVGRIKNAFRVDGIHDRVIFEKQIVKNGQ